MSEQSFKTLNVNILGFKVPLATSGEHEVVPQWLQNSRIGRSLAYIGHDFVDIEEIVLRQPVIEKTVVTRQDAPLDQPDVTKKMEDRVSSSSTADESTKSDEGADSIRSLEGSVDVPPGPKIFVEMDSNVLNFGYFRSGRHLSRRFTIVNESQVE